MNFTKALGPYLVLMALIPLLAQNASYDQFAPKPVPPTPAPTSAPPPPVKTTIGGDRKQVLLPKLRGLVFVGRQNDVQSVVEKLPAPIVIKTPVPDEPDFLKLTEPFVGHALTRGDLDNLITAIILYYRHHDHPVVDVVVPQQEITSGYVQILLLESRVGKVTVTGLNWFPPEEIRDSFQIQSGDPISASSMRADLAGANQNPFHTTDIVYQPGATTGVTDVELRTKDRFPVRFYTGYDDAGNPQTGFNQYYVGMNWGDAWNAGLGHQLNYQYTTDSSMQGLNSHSGSYVIPLPWDNNTLTFYGDYIHTHSDLPSDISVNGLTYQASGRYAIPLPDIGEYKSSVSVGFDYKYNFNGLQFGDVPLSTLPYEVMQFALSYDGSMRDDYGVSNIDAQVYCSPGDLTGLNQDANFNAAHTGATANYVYTTIEATRLTRLPFDFSLFLRAQLQFSDANLVPSEQIGFGGYDSIRGYDEREFNSDEGYITNVELRTPTVGLGDALKIPGLNDQLQFLLFWDYGSGYNHTLLPGEPPRALFSSLGGGLRYTINTYVSIRADYGFQLLQTGFDNDHGGRGDLGIVISY